MTSFIYFTVANAAFVSTARTSSVCCYGFLVPETLVNPEYVGFTRSLICKAFGLLKFYFFFNHLKNKQRSRNFLTRLENFFICFLKFHLWRSKQIQFSGFWYHQPNIHRVFLPTLRCLFGCRNSKYGCIKMHIAYNFAICPWISFFFFHFLEYFWIALLANSFTRIFTFFRQRFWKTNIYWILVNQSL